MHMKLLCLFEITAIMGIVESNNLPLCLFLVDDVTIFSYSLCHVHQCLILLVLASFLYFTGYEITLTPFYMEKPGA